MTKAQASKIATDLIEGGINSSGIVRIIAEANSASPAQVRAIKRILTRQGKDIRSILSMADAIDNGWEFVL